MPVNKTKKQSAAKKKTAAWSRWLHVYLSMLSFVIVLFFAVTGLTLNHTEWFDGQTNEQHYKGSVPAQWVNVTDTAKIKKLEIVELFRSKHKAKGYVSDFLIQDDQCIIAFKGPGYSADAFVNRKDGTYELNELSMGLMAVMNDLHKGRDSGEGWSWVIDISAVFLVLVSITGLVMLFFLKNKRTNGLLVALIGGVMCVVLYYWLLP